MNNSTSPILVILLCISIILMGCQRDKNLDFEIPFEGEKLSIYGCVSNEKSPKLEIYKTQAPLGSIDSVFIQNPENIIALLIEDGTVIDTFRYTGNKWEWKIENYITAASHHYSIQVIYEDQEYSSLPVMIPQEIPIDSFDYQYSDNIFNARIFFSDPPNELNYYYPFMTKLKDGALVGQIILPGFWRAETDDEILGSPKSFFLEDEFNNEQVDEVIIKLFHISPEFSSFYNRIFENDDNLGNQHSNQLPPWSNIINGYGFIGAYYVDSIRIEL